MLAPLASHHQALLHVQPVDTLHVYLASATAQQRVQPAMAIARLLPRQLHQRLAQLRVTIRSRFVPIARSLHLQQRGPHGQVFVRGVEQLAGRAFAQTMVGLNQRNIASQTGKLQPFFRITPFSASP